MKSAKVAVQFEGVVHLGLVVDMELSVEIDEQLELVDIELDSVGVWGPDVISHWSQDCICAAINACGTTDEILSKALKELVAGCA